MKIAIVENEEKERTLLRQYIARYGEENFVECDIDVYSNGVDFLTDNKGYDAVFLDIQMPMMNGMETAERLRKIDGDVQIIFVTNMAQYALEGYRVSALDFLVKPVGYVDIMLELKKIVKLTHTEEEFLYISGAGSFRRISYVEVRYIEVYNHQITIHLSEEEISYRGTLKDFEMKLKNKSFSRPDNCCIVNLRYVKKIDGDELILDQGQTLHISRARKKSFMLDLTNYINRTGR